MKFLKPNFHKKENSEKLKIKNYFSLKKLKKFEKQGNPN